MLLNGPGVSYLSLRMFLQYYAVRFLDALTGFLSANS